jgi:hypothetical protein
MKPGAGNHQVKVWVDGKLRVNNAASWEDSYRFDPEQAGNGNKLFGVARLVFVANSTAAPDTEGRGYLFDNVALEHERVGSTPNRGHSQPQSDHRSQASTERPGRPQRPGRSPFKPGPRLLLARRQRR